MLLPSPTDQTLKRFALGVRGPGIPGSENLLGTGISIPAFGIAHQRAREHQRHRHPLDAAHPRDRQHPGRDQRRPEHPAADERRRLRRLPGLAGGAAGAAGAGPLGALGGFGGFGGTAPRQDVGTKIKITPHLNDSDEVRLELSEEISDAPGAADRLARRRPDHQAHRADAARRQGSADGRHRRPRCETASRAPTTKIPMLGDIPVLGALFRSTQHDDARSRTSSSCSRRTSSASRPICAPSSSARCRSGRSSSIATSSSPTRTSTSRPRTTRARTACSRTSGSRSCERRREAAARGAAAPARDARRTTPGQPLELPAPAWTAAQRGRRRRRCRRRRRPVVRLHAAARDQRPARRRAASSASREVRAMASEQRFLGELLVRRGVVPAEQLERALRRAARARRRPRSICSSTANVADEADDRARARRRGAAPARRARSTRSTSRTALATRVPDRVREGAQDPRRRARTTHAVYVVCADPFDTHGARRRPRSSSASPSRPPSRRARPHRGRDQPRLRARGGRRRARDRRRPGAEDEGASDILDSDDEAPVIRWVNSLFSQAMKERASDIHIEPEEKEVIVRYRIDGELYVARRAPRSVHEQHRRRASRSRASLNIAEKRLPQDGRITHEDRRQELRHPRHRPSRRAAATSGSSCVSSTSRASCSTSPDLGFARASTR